MRLDGIEIKKFSPFAAQSVQLREFTNDGGRANVHIFVGENGTGKTRLLSLMLAACGNQKELEDRATEPVFAAVAATDSANIKLAWVSLQNAVIFHSDLGKYLSDGNINGVPRTEHSNLPAFEKGTVAMAFRSVAAIRDDKVGAMAAVDWGKPEDFLLFSRHPKDEQALCQALSNMKIRAGMYIAGNPGEFKDRTVRMTERLEKTLEVITGRRFVFLVEQDGGAVRLKVSWGGVRMRLHHLPDGLRAVISWLATCVAKLDLLLPNEESPLERPVLLFLDEPETHLHPAWQRQVIPALQSLLPNAQIFVATHSPFIVSSVNRGWLYVFKADQEGLVKIQRARECSKGDTYIDAVEDALGLKEWYDPETEALLAQFRQLRDVALSGFLDSDREAMLSLAGEIAKRSESLEVMMGHELAQFKAKERQMVSQGSK